MTGKFFDDFPFLYLHSLSCFSKLFDPRPNSVPKLYIDIYDKFEVAMCARGIADGSVKSLKTSSFLMLQYKSASKEVNDTIIL